MISELKSVIKSMKAAVQGASVDTNIGDRDSIYSGSGESSASGSGGIDEGDDEDSTASINKIPSQVLVNIEEDNSVDIPEVIVIKPSDLKPRETGRGEASYLHSCVLLLITSLLVQFM